MNEVILDTVQVALFPLDFVIGNSSVLATKYLENFLDTTPQHLKVNSFLDAGGPQDIVRVQSVVKGKPHVEVQISPEKISLYWHNLTSQPDFAIEDGEVQSTVSQLMSALNAAYSKDYHFGRVGYISTLFRIADDIPTQLAPLVRPRKPSTIPLKDMSMVLTYDFDSVIHGKVDDAVRYNEHIRIGAGYAKFLENKSALAIEYDINTRQLSEQPANIQSIRLNWDLDKVMLFIEAAAALSADKEEIYGRFFEV